MNFEIDSRNKDIFIFVKDKLYPRSEAKISVFDSAVQGGDAVWEGLRVYNGNVFALDRHLTRLQQSAKAMMFENIPASDWIKEKILATLSSNRMKDNVHIRLTLTRGEKITSGMSPAFNTSGCCLIIIAEWKPPVYSTNGIKLITSAVRRNPAQCVDSKIHHNNLINNILAKIQANLSGVDDAIMLDLNGFVAETNATNIFMIKKQQVYTPFPDSCLPGITRGIVIELCNENNISIVEKNISLVELYNADEAFTTGTMGEVTPVLEIDGRKIENKMGFSIVDKIKILFSKKIESETKNSF
ncbi:MAG: aminotransferase class IV [Ignavibacteriales bacterium]|nr:aminotransferase class IV [Ignavibacteriales bacterium]